MGGGMARSSTSIRPCCPSRTANRQPHWRGRQSHRPCRRSLLRVLLLGVVTFLAAASIAAEAAPGRREMAAPPSSAAVSDRRGGGPGNNETDIVNNNNKSCTKDGAVTIHGSTYTSNNQRCRCDNGVWGHCMELPNKESSHASEAASSGSPNDGRNFGGDDGFGSAASDGLILHGEWYASAIDGRTCMCMDMARTPSCAADAPDDADDAANGWPPKSDDRRPPLRDCAMDGIFTKHGRRYTSPSDGVTCACDDGTWTSCTSGPMTPRDGCRKDGAVTPHGARYTSATDGITCRCQDGVWVDCRNGAVGGGSSPSSTRPPTDNAPPPPDDDAPPTPNTVEKSSCRRDNINTEHGAFYSSSASGNRCKCQDGAWVDCKPIDDGSSRPRGTPPSSPARPGTTPSSSRPDGLPPSVPRSKNPCRRDSIETEHGKSYSSPISGNRCKCQDGAWVDCTPLSRVPAPRQPPSSSSPPPPASRNPPPNRTRPCLKDGTAWTLHGEVYASPSDNTQCKCQDGTWVECQAVSSPVRQAQSSPPPPQPGSRPPSPSPSPSGDSKRSCEMDNVETDHGSFYESPIDGKRCRCQDGTWVNCRSSSSSSAPGDGSSSGPSSPRRQQCITPSGDIVQDGAMYDPPGGDDSKRCRCWHGALHCGQDMLALQHTKTDSPSTPDGKGAAPPTRPPTRTQSPPGPKEPPPDKPGPPPEVPSPSPLPSPLPWPPSSAGDSNTPTPSTPRTPSAASPPPDGSTRQSSPPGRPRPRSSTPEEQVSVFMDPPPGSGNTEAYCLKDGVATRDGQYYASRVDGRRCLCENGSFVSCDDPPPGWTPGMQWLPAISAWVLPSSEGAGAVLSAEAASDDNDSNSASSPAGWPVNDQRIGSATRSSYGWPSPNGGGSSAAAVPPSSGWNTDNK